MPDRAGGYSSIDYYLYHVYFDFINPFVSIIYLGRKLTDGCAAVRNDEMWDTETCCRFKVLTVKLHIDFAHLVCYNEIL